jgi:MFS transporter, DHA1 family, multidrug resistance protein
MISNTRKLTYIVLINAIVLMLSMSSDIYLPSLPAMEGHLGATKTLLQLSVTAFTLSMGLSQFFAGPVSDAYGRKKPLLCATVLQIIALLGIILIPNINSILAFRALQGLGAALMAVPARAIINDILESDALKKQVNYLTITFAIGPIIAPFIGAYLQHYFVWQASFVFLLLFSVLILFMILFGYRETHHDRSAFETKVILRNYKHIFSDKSFRAWTVFSGLLFGYSVLFTVTGTFIVQKVMGYTVLDYGRVALLMGGAWFLGNIANRIFFHADKHLKSKICLTGTLIAAIVLLILALLGSLSLWALVIPAFFVIFFSGMQFPIYIGECLARFPKNTASANACLFSVTWCFFAAFSAIASGLEIHSLLPLAISYCIIATVSAVFYGLYVRRLT